MSNRNDIYWKEYELFHQMWRENSMTSVNIASLMVTVSAGALALTAEQEASAYVGLGVCYLLDFVLLWHAFHQGIARHVALHLVQLEDKMNAESEGGREDFRFYRRFAAGDAARRIPAFIPTCILLALFVASVWGVGFAHAIASTQEMSFSQGLLLFGAAAFALGAVYANLRVEFVARRHKAAMFSSKFNSAQDGSISQSGPRGDLRGDGPESDLKIKPGNE